jgi:hypothetical protein
MAWGRGQGNLAVDIVHKPINLWLDTPDCAAVVCCALLCFPLCALQRSTQNLPKEQH